MVLELGLFGTMNQFTFQFKLGGYSKRWNRGMKLHDFKEVSFIKFPQKNLQYPSKYSEKLALKAGQVMNRV